MVRDGDRPYRETVDEAPDYIPRTRPRSTVRVIGTLLLASVVGVFLFVQCVRLYVESTPDRTLDVRRSELEVGVPKLYPLPSQGADAQGNTYGVWIVLEDDGTALALLSRDPFDSCNVPWRTEARADGRTYTRVFRSPCHGAVYDIDGTLVAAPTSTVAQHPSVPSRLRGLDRYDVDVEATEIVVSLEQVQLGPCGPEAGHDAECSHSDAPAYRRRPPDPIVQDLPEPAGTVTASP
jgi:nitrite reductase/ring-hydroxylating ferredoxin subunit